MDGRFAAFVAVAALLIVIPGPDTALVTRNALRSGRRAAAFTAYGVGLGIAGWGAASVLGLALLLESSAMAFTVLKLAGAAYLCVLGAGALLAGRGVGERAAAPSASVVALGDRTAFVQGLLGNLLNPKAGAIFLTVLPQFVRTGDPPERLLLMLAAFEVILLLWLTLYGRLVARSARGSAGEHVRRWLRRVTGLVLIGLGLRLATESS